jgi:hypothetical protein
MTIRTLEFNLFTSILSLPSHATKNDQMARKWACRGSSNFIVQPGKHKRVTPIDI